MKKNKKEVLAHYLESITKSGQGLLMKFKTRLSDHSEGTARVTVSPAEIKAFKACKDSYDSVKISLGIYKRLGKAKKARTRTVINNPLAKFLNREDLVRSYGAKTKKVEKKTVKKASKKTVSKKKETAKKEALESVTA